MSGRGRARGRAQRLLEPDAPPRLPGGGNRGGAHDPDGQQGARGGPPEGRQGAWNGAQEGRQGARGGPPEGRQGAWNGAQEGRQGDRGGPPEGRQGARGGPPEGQQGAWNGAQEGRGRGGSGRARSHAVPEGQQGAAGPSRGGSSLSRPMRNLNLDGEAAGRAVARTGGSPRTDGTHAVEPPMPGGTKQGKGGTCAEFIVNYFKLAVCDWSLLRYRVDFSPDVDDLELRRYLLRLHRETLGWYVFSGSEIYTIKRLFPAQATDLSLTSRNAEDTQTYILTLRFANDVQYGDYTYIQVFNSLLRNCIRALDLRLIGRDYYDPKAKIRIQQHRVELWPGYKTSIRQHECGILMCVEIAHKVVREDTALNILATAVERDRTNYQALFARDVLGCVVLTRYNNKTYRIDDVAWDLNPSHTFLYQGEQISYADYIQRKYQIRITDLHQPLLVSRPSARDIRRGMVGNIHLIPEVCHMTGLTESMRANFQLKKALDEHTRIGPSNRIAKMMDFNRRLRSSEEATALLNRFEMKVDENLLRVPGRVLTEEKVYFEGRTEVVARDGQWRCGRMFLPKQLASWVVIAPVKFLREAASFIGNLQKAASLLGMSFAQPAYEEIPRDNVAAYIQALDRVLDRCAPQLVMCVVPSVRGDLYAAIKRKCYVDRAVASQVILSKNLRLKGPGISPIATKVAVQMNCKLGGVPWTVKMIANRSIMVVGYDVCHDPTRRSSVGAMVATLDPSMTKYFSCVTVHPDGEELSNNFGISINRAVMRYYEINSSLPDTIVIYRDGVGEGQIEYVRTVELENIKTMLAKIYKSQEVKMVFVIVTKRINTRIFTKDQGHQNPSPGTVVDDFITDPSKYDFFLVSQKVGTGTVTPTSYNIIYNSINLPAEAMQRFTYKLCHLYYNWNGTVRVPSLCQYAHKLAFLVGKYLHVPLTHDFENLFFL